MAVQSKPFYWLVCDAPECIAEYPGDGGDYTALANQEHLIELAPDSDWLIVNGKHFCDNHVGEHCHECGAALTEDEQDAGEYQCFKCAPELREAE